MKRLKLDTALPVVFLLLTSFVLGFHAQDVGASQGDFRVWLQSLQRLPERLDSIGRGVPSSERTTLPLIDTYSSVMLRLHED